MEYVYYPRYDGHTDIWDSRFPSTHVKREYGLSDHPVLSYHLQRVLMALLATIVVASGTVSISVFVRVAMLTLDSGCNVL